MIKDVVLEIESSKCNKCFKCISTCPVKICNDATGEGVIVDHKLCISCGACLSVCNTGARKFVDNSAQFFEDVKKDDFVAVVAPAVAANFPGIYLKLNGYLKSIGIKAIFDVSFGAELATKSYIEYIKEHNPKTVITQPCPSIVNYIERYQTELLPYLAPVDSPMLHTIKYIRTYFNEYKNHKIAVISPCIAKRMEFNDTFPEAYNVTFKSLQQHIADNYVDINKYKEEPYTGMAAERAVLFSTPGGLKRTVERLLPGISNKVRKIEGKEQIYDYLKDLKPSIDKGVSPLIVDCLNCEKGCNGGSGTNSIRKSIDEIENDVEVRNEIHKKEQKKIDKTINNIWVKNLFNRSYTNKSSLITDVKPTDLALNEIYSSMDKFSECDMFNCSSCGYNSCELMALSIYNNKNVPENCYHFRLSQLNQVEVRNKSIAEKIDEEVKKSTILTSKAHEKMNIMETYTHCQIEAIEQSSAAVEEMLASIRSISNISHSRKKVLSDMNIGFSGVSDDLEKIVKSAISIDESVVVVDDMNKLINDVAERTNLLSMNAAIEAARAGHSGKGFSVVAGEIKKLADASSFNANQIKESLKGITQLAKTSVDISTNTKQKSRDMSDIVDKVKNSFNEITDGMSEISIGSDEISDALSVISSSGSDVESLYKDVKEVMSEMMLMINNMENLLKELLVNENELILN